MNLKKKWYFRNVSITRGGLLSEAGRGVKTIGKVGGSE